MRSRIEQCLFAELMHSIVFFLCRRVMSDEDGDDARESLLAALFNALTARRALRGAVRQEQMVRGDDMSVGAWWRGRENMPEVTGQQLHRAVLPLC